MNDDPARLKDLLGPFGKRLGLRDPASTGLVWARWEEIVGPGIAAHCRPSSLREGVLRLRADGPTWATEVGYLGEDIKRKVNAAAGARLVSEVRVWVGPDGPDETRRRPAPPEHRDRGSETGRKGSDGDPLEALARAREAWSRRVRRGRS